MDPANDFASRYGPQLKALFERSGGARWGLPLGAFADALAASVEAWSASLSQAAPAAAVEDYLSRLHLEDLAVAAACRSGIEAAWEYFIEHYRPVLYAGARRLTRDQAQACELADSLYAELYGLRQRGGERVSLFAYFHGRSTLKAWLHAVLAQRYIDSTRIMRRTEPLENAPEAAAADDPPDPNRERYVDSFTHALGAALDQLAARDRMRLNFHYVEELTLKEIGRLMGEHESTVSRRLARTRMRLRREVERMLRREARLNDEQIRMCYDYAIEFYSADLSRLLAEPR